MTDEWTQICPMDAVQEGEPFGTQVGGMRIAIYKDAGELFALDDVCTHAYALMSQGFQEDGRIECPLHGGQFEIRTGKAVCGPLDSDLRTYPVRATAGQVYVCLRHKTGTTDETVGST